MEVFDSGDLSGGANNWDIFGRLESLKRFDCEWRFVSEGFLGDVMS